MDDTDKAADKRAAFPRDQIRESMLYAVAAMKKFIAAVTLSGQNVARSRGR
jgi:hypothetical protein